MSALYVVEPLAIETHRVAEFTCEEPELADFLRSRAMSEMTARASACFVLVPKASPEKTAGFYTLSAGTISLGKLPPEMTSRLPQYPNLPATLLGRLARDDRWRGQGIGELLLMSALSRAVASTASVGSVAVVTDPKSAKAADFYRQNGFRELGSGRRMYLSMTDIAVALRDGGVR